MRPIIVGFGLLAALGGCTDMAMDPASDGEPGFIASLPEEVSALAAPGQDLTAVRLMPEDGCYWYRYRGVVETTMLPLRTPAGNPICVAPAA